MRSFIDDKGRIGWIFDEKTHPLGNEQKKQEEIKIIPTLIVEEPEVKKSKKFFKKF